MGGGGVQADSHTPGGSYRAGGGGAEEALCRRSNLGSFLANPEGAALYPIEDDGVRAPGWGGRLQSG